MPSRARFVGRSAIGASLLWILLASCGSENPSSAVGSDDGGTGDDGSVFGDTGGGDEGGTGGALGAPTTCIVGTQGCLCDSTGGCAPGLTCTPQAPPRLNLCCNGTNCASTSGTVGKSCSAVSGAPSCTPGVTVPPAAGGNDSCGYLATTFLESTTLCAINAVGGGPTPAIIQVFYMDEHALTLGCETPTSPVSPLSIDPDATKYPKTGDPACVDTVGRPLRPVVYITDISADPNCKAGDQQQGGPAYDPVAVFGTWKSATADGTPLADPQKNGWNLTPSGDPVPAAAMTCKNEGYGAEVRFEVGLISGHSYRIQVIVHDGDQNKGGDSGEACAIFCAGSGSLCNPGVTQCVDGSTCPSGTTCVQGCCLSNIK